MPVKPISMSGVAEKIDLLPDFVIKTWNNIITNHWDGSSAVIYQTYIILKLIIASSPELITRETIINKRWLDIENIYRAEGWNVRYWDAYDGNYEPAFMFTRNKK